MCRVMHFACSFFISFVFTAHYVGIAVVSKYFTASLIKYFRAVLFPSVMGSLVHHTEYGELLAVLHPSYLILIYSDIV